MHPARRLHDETRHSPRQVELSIAIVSVGLKDAGVPGEMCLRVFSLPVA
jgi:hypothetical protein